MYRPPPNARPKVPPSRNEFLDIRKLKSIRAEYPKNSNEDIMIEGLNK
jgi:hypothetical protein